MKTKNNLVAPLQEKIADHLKINKSRANLIALFIITAIQRTTVNLAKLATAFPRKTKPASNYRRLQRFFSFFKFSKETVARLIAGLVPLVTFGLSMDRTNWKWGKVDINILVLGIVYKGICFPIFWMLLPKRGNSNTEERIKIINWFLKTFGKEKFKYLLADREFVGTLWFHFLLSEKLDFVIRIKENFLLDNGKQVKQLFRGLQVGEERNFDKPFKVCGNRLYLSGMRLESEYLILVTPKPRENAVKIYAKRWEVETLFGCLKSKGFNFEETHMTDPKKISKMLSLLAIAFCWAHKIGEWLNEKKPIKLKKHGRPARSIFRYGLDFLQNIFFNITDKFRLFQKSLEFLSCT